MDNSKYTQGFIDGVRAYAYMRDGKYYVGTTGRTLEKAILNVEETWNFNPSPTVEANPKGLNNHETLPLSTENP
jgi:hypothetical protein